jgi:hypothetical protein
VVVYIPVADPPVRGAAERFVIPATGLATTVHTGPHDDIDVTYAALGAYVSQPSWDLAGPRGAAEWTSVADELAPGSAAMSAPRTCWDRVRGCPAVVDSDLGGGGCGPPTL